MSHLEVVFGEVFLTADGRFYSHKDGDSTDLESRDSQRSDRSKPQMNTPELDSEVSPQKFDWSTDPWESDMDEWLEHSFGRGQEDFVGAKSKLTPPATQPLSEASSVEIPVQSLDAIVRMLVQNGNFMDRIVTAVLAQSAKAAVTHPAPPHALEVNETVLQATWATDGVYSAAAAGQVPSQAFCSSQECHTVQPLSAGTLANDSDTGTLLSFLRMVTSIVNIALPMFLHIEYIPAIPLVGGQWQVDVAQAAQMLAIDPQQGISDYVSRTPRQNNPRSRRRKRLLGANDQRYSSNETSVPDMVDKSCNIPQPAGGCDRSRPVGKWNGGRSLVRHNEHERRI
jgi:hypothetical protein